VAHLDYHAKVIAEKARARAVIHAGMKLIAQARNGEDAYLVASQAAIEIGKLGATNGFGLAIDLWQGPAVLKEPEVAPDWICEPFFAREDVVIVQADSGVGKTWFILDMMLHSIAGREFLGKFMCTPTRWLYCDFDMHPDGYIVKRRLKRLARGVDLKFGEDWHVMTRKHLPGAINLTTGEGMNVLESTIREKRVDVVVLEVFGGIHGAGNENDSAQMEPVMSRLRDFGARNHCAIILPHHTRKRQQGQDDDPTSSGRGSTTIKNRADCVIDLRIKKSSPEDDEAQRTVVVSHVKARYLKQLPDFCVRIEDNSLTGGTEITYLGNSKQTSATSSKFETWLTHTLWPKITASGLTEAWQKEVVEAAEEEGICSDKIARAGISSLEQRGLIAVRWKREPGEKMRRKILQLVSNGTGGKTGGIPVAS
jgi:hypothetical protein